MNSTFLMLLVCDICMIHCFAFKQLQWQNSIVSEICFHECRCTFFLPVEGLASQIYLSFRIKIKCLDINLLHDK